MWRNMLCEKVKDKRTSRKCVLSVFYSIREIRERRKACVACAVGEMRERESKQCAELVCFIR